MRAVTDPEISCLWKFLLMELEPLKGLLVQIKQSVFLAVGGQEFFSPDLVLVGVIILPLKRRETLELDL